MKKLVALIGSVAVAASMLAGCAALGVGGNDSTSTASDTAGKVKVVASFYAMADFAQKIGGDRVEVTNLVPAGTEPHDWEPSTQDMKLITSAQVLVYNGAGMERWVDDVVSSADSSSLVTVEASKGADLLQASEDEHDHDHDHEEESDHDHEGEGYDPHVWLSPTQAKVELANIRDGLIKADPAGKDTFEANYEKYAAELDDLYNNYKDKLSKVSKHDIVVSHQAFGYLCNDFGLTQLAISGIEADSEPDAKTMAEIVDFVKQNNVSTIFTEELVSPKVAQAIADASGASVEELNPLEGLSQEELDAGEDYFSVMKSNLDKLVSALS